MNIEPTRKIAPAALWVLVAGAVVFYYTVSFFYNTTPSEYEKEKIARVELVNSWLKEQRNGRDGYYYWLENLRPARLYSVESWEVLESDKWRTTVLVNSSTKGGIPIRKTWEVGFSEDHNGKPKIYRLTDLSL